MSGAVPLLLLMSLRCAQENVQLTFALKMYKQHRVGICAFVINYTILSSARLQALAVLRTGKEILVVFEKNYSAVSVRNFGHPPHFERVVCNLWAKV